MKMIKNLFELSVVRLSKLENSFDLQIIFKINIHSLAQVLHVEGAYELQETSTSSPATLEQWNLLFPISLDILCRQSLFLRGCYWLVQIRRQKLMAVTVILNFPKVSSLRKWYLFLLEILRSCFSLPPLKIKFKSSHLRDEQVKCSRNKTNPQRSAMTVVIESHDV